MVSPERVQPQYGAEDHRSSPEQDNYAHSQDKFRQVAYEAADQRSNDRGGRSSERSDDRKNQDKSNDDKKTEDKRHLFDGHIIKGIFRRKDKPDAKDDAKDNKKDEDKDVKLEKEGTVESLKLPQGFTKGKVEKEDNYMEFPGKGKDEKICYQRRGDYTANDDDAKKIAEVMNKPPHQLTEQETLDLLPCMNPGRWAGNGNFKMEKLDDKGHTLLDGSKKPIPSLRTEDIGGKRVLVGELTFNDQDKKVAVIFASPDRDKHTIELLWHEGSAKDFEHNRKAVIDAFKQIKWNDAPNAQRK